MITSHICLKHLRNVSFSLGWSPDAKIWFPRPLMILALHRSSVSYPSYPPSRTHLVFQSHWATCHSLSVPCFLIFPDLRTCGPSSYNILASLPFSHTLLLANSQESFRSQLRCHFFWETFPYILQQVRAGCPRLLRDLAHVLKWPGYCSVSPIRLWTCWAWGLCFLPCYISQCLAD